MKGKEALKILEGQREGAKRREIDKPPVVSQQYITGTVGHTFARATRREQVSVENFQEKRTACLSGKGRVERERFSVRARSGVGDPVRIGLSEYRGQMRPVFMGLLLYGRGKGEGGREEGKEKPPIGAGKCKVHP